MKKYKKNILILFILVIILVSAFLLYDLVYLEYESRPNIKLIGKIREEINLDEKYIEKGAKAYLRGKNISERIVKSGEVNAKKVGEYKIRYTVLNNKGRKRTTIIRKVLVIDNIKPIITLIGKNEISIYLNSQYVEKGYKAIDNVDGDITDKVKVTNNINITKLGQYLFTYSVTDASNNKMEITRKVNVVRNKGTGIAVLMYHFFYDKSAGGNASNSNYIEISTFESHISYLKQNNYYFPSWEEIRRFVKGEIKLSKKSVVITVDDGNPTFFNLAVPILQKYNVPATAFIITSRTNPSNYSNIKDVITFMSHSNSMHSYGCSGGLGKFTCLSYDKALLDVTTSKNIVNGNVFCYPFGHYNDHTIKVLKDAGYSLAFTTVYGKIYQNDNPFTLSRIRMSTGTTLNSLINILR